jgi:hypothetical protein
VKCTMQIHHIRAIFINNLEQRRPESLASLAKNLTGSYKININFILLAYSRNLFLTARSVLNKTVQRTHVATPCFGTECTFTILQSCSLHCPLSTARFMHG